LEAGLKPRRMERYLASDDPDFETKAPQAFRFNSSASARHRSSGRLHWSIFGA